MHHCLAVTSHFTLDIKQNWWPHNVRCCTHTYQSKVHSRTGAVDNNLIIHVLHLWHANYLQNRPQTSTCIDLFAYTHLLGAKMNDDIFTLLMKCYYSITT